MVRAGYADVYTQAGAQYGGPENERLLRNALHYAQWRRRGMWSAPKVVLPSEYKRQLKENGLSSEDKRQIKGNGLSSEDKKRKEDAGLPGKDKKRKEGKDGLPGKSKAKP
jgi:hypothetical protein